jgi:hypothetical protein
MSAIPDHGRYRGYYRFYSRDYKGSGYFFMCSVKPMPRVFFGSGGIITWRIASNATVNFSLMLASS